MPSSKAKGVGDRAIADPAFRRQFRLRDWEDELLAVDPGFPDPAPTSRFDAFLTPDYPMMLARMVPHGQLFVMEGFFTPQG